MNLTKALKQWLVDHCGVKQDAADDEYKRAAGEAMATGKLSPAKLVELTTDPVKKDADEFTQKLESVVGGLAKLTELLTPKQQGEAEEDADAIPQQKAAPRPQAKLSKRIAELGGTPDELDDDIDVVVKQAADQYATTKGTLTYPSHNKAGMAHPLAGKPVRDYQTGGRVIDEASDLDKAVAGSWAKYLVAKTQTKHGPSAFERLRQHDKELLLYAMKHMSWGGASHENDEYADIKNRKLTELEQKALIDDSTSGGLEAAPIVFDDQVIQTPLLHGELFPLVNTIPLDRGRRVEGLTTGTVTASWGGVDDTAITLFNTASYVSAFDTTVYRWEGSIQIGLDFLSDTPIDFGAHVTAQYGERLMEDVDDVIASGNGTTQPEGVINKSGITSVAFGGSTSIGNYESLRFSVAKAEHRANVASSAVFCGTETSYQRVRALPVGASDARRLFGMDHFNSGGGGYTFGGSMYKINESLSNQQIFYAVLARYRMYLRRGLTMRSSTEGETLVRNNELLLCATARYGGQLERAAAGAITTTAPA